MAVVRAWKLIVIVWLGSMLPSRPEPQVRVVPVAGTPATVGFAEAPVIVVRFGRVIVVVSVWYCQFAGRVSTTLRASTLNSWDWTRSV